MAFDLAAMWRRTRNPRRPSVTLRPIRAPSVLATDLLQISQTVIAEWERAIPDLIAEYRRTLATITTDSPADIRIKIDGRNDVVAQLMLSIRTRLARWAQMAEQRHRRKWQASVLTATGVDLKTLIGPEAARITLETAIERNVDLIRNVSDQARGRIADAVFRGFTQRKSADDVAKELREAVAMARRRARLIASDQTAKLSAALDQDRRREAGIDTWEWVSSGKENAREEHEDRDGVQYSDDDPPPEMPGELINCGCTSRAVLTL